MATVVISIGARTSSSVTVSSQSSTTLADFANAYLVNLSATVPAATVIGDKLTTGANDYLIVGISGAQLTVVGDPYSVTGAPSVGSGATLRGFPSISTWFSGAPSSLVTKNWVWKGNIYPEGTGSNGEWQLSGYISLTGKTTDSTRYFHIAAAPGYSIADNAGKLTNALRYNPANGVALNSSDFGLFYISNMGYTIIEGLQIYNANVSNAFIGPISFDGVSSIGTVKNCLIKSARTDNNMPVVALNNVGSSVSNCVIISSAQNGVSGYSTVSVINCTIINNGTAGTSVGIVNSGGVSGPIVKNTAVFGFNTVYGGSYATMESSSNYNATNLSPTGINWGANSLTGLTATSQFQAVTAGSEDLRIIVGSSLINAGTRQQTYTNDLDIVGSSRSLTTPTIGAWEYASAAPTSTNYTSPLSRGMFRGNQRGVA